MRRLALGMNALWVTFASHYNDIGDHLFIRFSSPVLSLDTDADLFEMNNECKPVVAELVYLVTLVIWRMQVRMKHPMARRLRTSWRWFQESFAHGVGYRQLAKIRKLVHGCRCHVTIIAEISPNNCKYYYISDWHYNSPSTPAQHRGSSGSAYRILSFCNFLFNIKSMALWLFKNSHNAILFILNKKLQNDNMHPSVAL